MEAILFSAVGFIFGKEVNRTRAEIAEIQKEKAEKEKEIAKDHARTAEDKGKRLAEKVLDKVEAPPAAPDDFKLRSLSQGNEKQQLIDLAHYAKKLYPSID